MKAAIVFLLIITAISVGCSSNGIVGKWQVKQRFDRFEESWKPVDDFMTLEFSSDGRYTSSVRGRLTSGTYSVDEIVSPHRLVLNDDKAGRVNVIFRLEGNKLRLKANMMNGATQFPADLDSGGDDDFELAELERN